MIEQGQAPQQFVNILLGLQEDYYSINASHVHSSEYPLAIEFCRQVSKGLPCVYAVRDAPSSGYGLAPKIARSRCRGARKLEARAFQWTRSYLEDKVPNAVDVAVTPDGRADSLYSLDESSSSEVFLEPASTLMTIKELFHKFDNAASRPETTEVRPVFYLQSQNGNLTNTALATLLEDLPANIPFAEEVLGQPDAVNLWIGDEQSVTSVHRDPYENLYLVLKGTKTFTLWAPVDQIVRTGRWVYSSSSDSFSRELEDSSARIPWISIDPLLSRHELNERYPHYQYARPQKVVVTEGNMLYLPAGWFHHVGQACGTWEDGSKAPCIAVNYWYDQEYEGEKYVMRQMIERLNELVHSDVYKVGTEETETL